MDILVVLFFVFNVLAATILGGKFFSKNDNYVFRSFGISLLLNAVAFAIWSFGVISPENLLPSVTLGAIVFLISLVFLFYTSIQNIQSALTRKLLMLLGIIIVIGIFYVGNTDPSQAYISPEGFLFFNLGPLVQMLYIFVLSLAIFPAIDLVASKFKSPYATIFRYGVIAEVCGGIMLITSRDAHALYITGWIICLVYLVLLGVFTLNSKAWSEQ